MLFLADDLATSHARQRRQELMAEAQAYRLARQARSGAQPSVRTAPPRGGWLLHAAGTLLVRWGTRLQAHSTPAPFVESRPA